MKHLLINPYTQEQEWCKDYFPDRSLGMMPVGGRCAAEYFIDLALRCNADSLLLLGPTYNEHLAEHLMNISMANWFLSTAREAVTVQSGICLKYMPKSAEMIV